MTEITIIILLYYYRNYMLIYVYHHKLKINKYWTEKLN